MDLTRLVKAVDARTAEAFVRAARHVIDALLIEADRVRQVQTRGRRDYNTAGLSRETPGGGWLSHAELRDTARQMAEAVAAEKWSDGVLFAIRILSGFGVG